VIAALIVVIVLLAIAPWENGNLDLPPAASEPQADASSHDAGAPATGAADGEAGSPVSPAVPHDPLAVTCGSPSGWRAATLQAWGGRTEPIRSWIAIQPVAAVGPLDTRIPFVPVATGIVTAVGYCAPSDDSRPPATARTSLWAVSDGVATPLSLLPLEPATPNALGGLWMAPAELDGPTPVGSERSPSPGASVGTVAQPRLWPPGRYALQVAVPGGVYDRWLGVDVVDLSLRTSPLPGPTSAAPASPVRP